MAGARLSGFPEWLPEGRIVEQSILDTARRVFELHGFASLETRAVEPLAELTRKGEIDKEVYVVRRLHAEGDADSGLGLHFDLTVPFARYVVENAGKLEFPFRRYQVQKVWRGERPQEGRFREFTQADIDVVDKDSLAFHYEVEMAVVMSALLAELPIPRAVIHVSNRKLAEGFYRAVGATDTASVLRVIDKIDKVSEPAMRTMLAEQAGLSDSAIDLCLRMATIQAADASFVTQVKALGVSDPLLDEGLDELARVVSATSALRPGSIVADLKIARGLDYYTGTVYETELEGFASLGSISSGGRYDALASDGKVTYPGVGISLGVTRLVSVLLGKGLLTATRSVPSAVLVAVLDEATRPESESVAALLRSQGIACEVASKPDKLGKQIRFAERRGIPFVWFPDTGSVKDIRSGEQVDADASTWQPPASDLHPRVLRTTDQAIVASPSSQQEDTP
jgi:histidyl-tRNA synthetase